MSMISFARGVPAPECLPVEDLADCARVAVRPMKPQRATTLQCGQCTWNGSSPEKCAAALAHSRKISAVIDI